MSNKSDEEKSNDYPIKYTNNDVIPENYPYRNKGCELAESCLNCPFDECTYITHISKRNRNRIKRQKELRKLRSKDIYINQLAAHFNVHKRTILRDLRAMRDEDWRE